MINVKSDHSVVISGVNRRRCSWQLEKVEVFGTKEFDTVCVWMSWKRRIAYVSARVSVNMATLV